MFKPGIVSGGLTICFVWKVHFGVHVILWSLWVLIFATSMWLGEVHVLGSLRNGIWLHLFITLMMHALSITTKLGIHNTFDYVWLCVISVRGVSASFGVASAWVLNDTRHFRTYLLLWRAHIGFAEMIYLVVRCWCVALREAISTPRRLVLVALGDLCLLQLYMLLDRMDLVKLRLKVSMISCVA